MEQSPLNSPSPQAWVTPMCGDGLTRYRVRPSPRARYLLDTFPPSTASAFPLLFVPRTLKGEGQILCVLPDPVFRGMASCNYKGSLAIEMGSVSVTRPSDALMGPSVHLTGPLFPLRGPS